MNKIILTTVAILCVYNNVAWAQLNIEKLGYLDYGTTCLSNVWGYTQNGKEYALVGLCNGTSIVDVTDPANPAEVQHVAGPDGIWREIKTWQNWAFITSQTGSIGLTIVDLSPLPDTVYTYYWKQGVLGSDTVNITNCHALFVNEQTGRIYLTGCDYKNKGVIMLDPSNSPQNPQVAGVYNNQYVHDCYERKDTLYTAEIYAGQFSVIDVSKPATPNVLAVQKTPDFFTHNCWLTDNGRYLFTTDEVQGAYITGYDLSDINDIKETDRFRTYPPVGVIPHNTYVKGNYLVTSYYANGVIINDISDPHTIVEVGNYDTSALLNNNFNGCWGVYPYLPSGLFLASDMEEGLFILKPSFIQAAFIEGKVISNFGFDIPDVSVTILEDLNTAVKTNFSGKYKTGIGTSGEKAVVFYKYGFEPDTIKVNFVNGETMEVNVTLNQKQPFVVDFTVVDAISKKIIPDAKIDIKNFYKNQSLITDNNGQANAIFYYDDLPSDIFSGAWGWRTQGFANQTLNADTKSITIELLPGYYDDFTFDFGWIATKTAEKGQWTRTKPIGKYFIGDTIVPFADATNDIADLAFVTANSISEDAPNVSKGYVMLTSPALNLAAIENPKISYQRWFYTQNPGSDDHYRVLLSNGTDTVEVEALDLNFTPLSEWVTHTFTVADYLPPTDGLFLIVLVEDLETGNNHITNGGFDVFEVLGQSKKPVAKFTPTSTTICLNDNNSVKFLNTSLGDPATETIWYLPGSTTPVVINDPSPTVTYPNAGTYDVGLVVKNAYGSDSVYFANLIIVNPKPNFEVLIATKTYPNIDPLCENSVYELGINADVPIESYFFEGPGIIFDAVSGKYSLNTTLPGTYTYTATVTDNNGCTNQLNFNLEVHANTNPPVLTLANSEAICSNNNTTVNLQFTADMPYTTTWNTNFGSFENTTTVTPPATWGNDGYACVHLEGQFCSTKTQFDTCIYANIAPKINTITPYFYNEAQQAWIPSDGILTNDHVLCTSTQNSIKLQATATNLPFSTQWSGENLIPAFVSANGDSIVLNEFNFDLSYYLTAKLIDAKGCQTENVFEFLAAACIDGINDLRPSELQCIVQPNPATEQVIIVVTSTKYDNEPIETRLYNALGQEVWRGQPQYPDGLNRLQMVVPLQNLAFGMYNLVAWCGNTYVRTAIVRQ